MNQPRPTTRKRARRERPGRPACPEWIDSEAKEVWSRVTAAMRDMAILTRADGNLLARYAQTYVRWVRAEQFLQQRGEIYPVKSNTGIVRFAVQNGYSAPCPAATTR